MLEPACGAGDMARPLGEFFAEVVATDIANYGFGGGADFLAPGKVPAVDWVITNPPFNLAEAFIRRGVEVATVGVAMLVRTTFLASQKRCKLFKEYPPVIVAQFAERVPMFEGRLDPNGSTATDYLWIVWRTGETDTKMMWIPPCRKELERVSDYQLNNKTKGE